jgi:hypothetical protein
MMVNEAGPASTTAALRRKVRLSVMSTVGKNGARASWMLAIAASTAALAARAPWFSLNPIARARSRVRSRNGVASSVVSPIAFARATRSPGRA